MHIRLATSPRERPATPCSAITSTACATASSIDAWRRRCRRSPCSAIASAIVREDYLTVLGCQEDIAKWHPRRRIRRREDAHVSKGEDAYKLFEATIGETEGTGDWIEVTQDRIN